MQPRQKLARQKLARQKLAATVFGIAAVGLGILVACSESSSSTGQEASVLNAALEPPEALPGDTRPVVDGNTAFACDLYTHLRQQKGNLFFSPFSISTALAMTCGGARGDTASRMRKTLHFTIPDERLHPTFFALANMKPGKCQLHIANRLWSQEGFTFLDAYLNLTEVSYGARLQPVNFATATEEARKTINAWVEKKTGDKIKELLKRPHLSSATVLVLTNAIYFKGQWASRFKKKETREGTPFTLVDGNRVKVAMMHQQADFRHACHDELDILELPYAGGELSMIILLPRKADGLPGVEKSLTASRLESWLAGLSNKEINVFLPRFKMTCPFALGDALKKMGMAVAFTPSADFSGMTGSKNLYISKVIHQAFVDVNEEGTEAAAATAVVMDKGKPRVIEFRADHPFLFLIRHNSTGSLLFLGRVMNPAE